MFNDLSASPLTYLQSRRSGRPRDMVAPGPDIAAMRAIVTDARRTPDHGKLAPWRTVLIAPDQRTALANLLRSAYVAENPAAGRLELDAMDAMAMQAPALLILLFSPRQSSNIPLWEQQLSCGAFGMNLLHAAHMRGFVGGWLTGWPAYSAAVRDAFGAAPEVIAGFFYFGTPSQALSERPRPDTDELVSLWDAPPHLSE
jgi:nitroreductase